MIGEFLVEAGLERAGQDQRPPWPVEIEDLECLPGRGLSVQSLANAIALLNASVGRFGEPIVQRWRVQAEYAGARRGLDRGRSRCGLTW